MKKKQDRQVSRMLPTSLKPESTFYRSEVAKLASSVELEHNETVTCIIVRALPPLPAPGEVK